MKSKMIVKRSGQVRLERAWQSSKFDHFSNNQDVVLRIDPIRENQIPRLPKAPDQGNRQTKQGKQPGFIERAFASANEPGKGNPKTQTEHDPEQ